MFSAESSVNTNRTVVVQDGAQHIEFAVTGHALADECTIQTALSNAVRQDTVHNVSQLPGSFSGVITTPEQITAFGDLSNQFPLYYNPNRKDLGISTSTYELAQKSNSRVDLTTIAMQICGLTPIAAEFSFFSDIRRLRGGEQARIANESLDVQVFEPLVPKPTICMEEAAIRTRDSLVEAITSRPTVASSDFSGGLDSTTLAFLATSLHNQDLPVFMLYNPNYPAGDSLYARQFAALDPRIKLHELITDNNQLPYSFLKDRDRRLPFVKDEPARGLITLGCEITHQPFTVDLASPHITGMGGDALYGGKARLADFLRNGDIRQASEAAVTQARVYLADPDRLLANARANAKISLSEAFSLLAETFTDPSSQQRDTDWFPALINLGHWLTPKIRQAVASRLAEIGSKKLWGKFNNAGDLNTVWQIWDNGEVQRHQRTFAGSNFDLHAPYLDTNVILAATCLRAQDRNQVGSFKSLLRSAVTGLVPPQIYEQRRGKGDYTAEMFAGVRQAMPEILDLLANSRLAAFGVIDPVAVRQTLRTIDVAQTFPFHGLAAVVSAEIWLRQLEARERAESREVFCKIQNTPTALDAPHNLENESHPILNTRLCLSEHLNIISGPRQIVILNTVDQTLEAGNHTTGAILQVINNTGSAHEAVRYLAGLYPSIPKGQLEEDVASLVQNMLEQGLLTASEAVKSRPISSWHVDPAKQQTAHTGETMRVRALSEEENFLLSSIERIAGESALAKVFELSEYDFGKAVDYLLQAKQNVKRPASKEEAHRNLVIIHKVAGRVGRVACYERSLATSILGAWQGINIEWVIGAAFNPLRFHAWAEAQGEVVTTSADDQIEGIYQGWLRS